MARCSSARVPAAIRVIFALLLLSILICVFLHPSFDLPQTAIRAHLRALLLFALISFLPMLVSALRWIEMLDIELRSPLISVISEPTTPLLC